MALTDTTTMIDPNTEKGLSQAPQHPASPDTQVARGGWVKLYRGLMNKPIWQDSTLLQRMILIILLMKASYRETTWVHNGIPYHIKPGQLITSVNSLVEECGEEATTRKVRTALSRFQKYQFLTMETTSRNTLITLTNWEVYQADAPTVTSPPAQSCQSVDKAPSSPGATIKKVRMSKTQEGEEPLPLAAAVAAKDKQTTAPCPFEEIVSLYNRHCTTLPKVKQINNLRKEIMHNRWAEYRQDLSVFEKLFKNAHATPYLQGQNNRGWRSNFDWLLQEPNMTRVLEGIYKDMFQPSKSSARLERTKPHTGFHLSESRFSHYTNEQLEQILQVGKKRRPSLTPPEREAIHGS